MNDTRLDAVDIWLNAAFAGAGADKEVGVRIWLEDDRWRAEALEQPSVHATGFVLHRLGESRVFVSNPQQVTS